MMHNRSPLYTAVQVLKLGCLAFLIAWQYCDGLCGYGAEQDFFVVVQELVDAEKFLGRDR